jgi:hypothetical protein
MTHTAVFVIGMCVGATIAIAWATFEVINTID